MKFQVPQFVEVEDKLFWHLTLKQFIYVAGGCGMSIIFYLLLPLFVAMLFIIPIMALSLSLAFYKYNDRPFIVLVEAATKYIFNSKLYIWHKVDVPVAVNPEKTQEDTGATFIPKLSDSKLKELTWSLDTKESVNPVTKSDKTL
ncbi:MAG: seg [Candidatus Paceibacter sp.]|jgi:hypothetical protein|nr:seg [Candidatus Paceibacter sp.]